MQFIKVLTNLFAAVGLFSIGYFSYGIVSYYNTGGNVLGAQTSAQPQTQDDQSSYINNSTPLDNSIAIPTIRESAVVPTIELVNCWEKTSDGVTKYDFGQISKEECAEKVKKLQEEWEKTIGDTIKKQTNMNNDSSLAVPQNLDFKQ